jgi:hypothetical protein
MGFGARDMVIVSNLPDNPNLYTSHLDSKSGITARIENLVPENRDNFVDHRVSIPSACKPLRGPRKAACRLGREGHRESQLSYRNVCAVGVISPGAVLGFP